MGTVWMAQFPDRRQRPLPRVRLSTARKPRTVRLGGLAALLGLRPAVLASSAVVERFAPFSPARSRLVKQGWVGLKGAACYTKADEVSTGANAVSEARNETPECSRPGLSGCKQQYQTKR